MEASNITVTAKGTERTARWKAFVMVADVATLPPVLRSYNGNPDNEYDYSIKGSLLAAITEHEQSRTEERCYCPSCGRCDLLSVTVSGWRGLDADGGLADEVENSVFANDFDSLSRCKCECGWSGQLYETDGVALPVIDDDYDDTHCLTCRATLDDEGWEGMCGDCADIACNDEDVASWAKTQGYDLEGASDDGTIGIRIDYVRVILAERQREGAAP